MTEIFAGAVAVVTGGGSGIGRALAHGAALHGATVAVADIELATAVAVAEEIVAKGGRAKAYGCDVAEDDRVRELASQVRADLGPVGLVFANAGVIAGGVLEKTRPTDAMWMFSVNVLGMINVNRAFLPLLREAKAAGGIACIVNTGSENSFGVPVLGPNSVYTATKHAVLGLSDALRRDLEGSGIGVCVLCPGLVATEIFDARRNRPDRFGGPTQLSAEHATRAREMMAEGGQDPAVTAEICFEGVERGDFLIVTDPKIRGFADKRHREVEAALDRIDMRLG